MSYVSIKSANVFMRSGSSKQQRWHLASANARLCGNYCVPTPAVQVSPEAQRLAKRLADFLWGEKRPRVNCS